MKGSVIPNHMGVAERCCNQKNGKEIAHRTDALCCGLASPLFSSTSLESSLGLTAAWWALQMSTYSLSTYGSFWACHLVFHGGALSSQSRRGSLRKDLQNSTLQDIPCCVKLLIVYRHTEPPTFLGSFLLLVHEEVRGGKQSS